MIHDSDIVPSLIFYQHDDHDTSQSTINIVVRTTSIFKKNRKTICLSLEVYLKKKHKHPAI